MRESYRLQKNGLEDYLNSKNIFLYIFFIYTGKELPDYKSVSESFAESLAKLQKVME